MKNSNKALNPETSTWTCQMGMRSTHGHAPKYMDVRSTHGQARRVRGCYSNEHLAKFQISIDIVALTRNSELVVMSPNLTQKVH